MRWQGWTRPTAIIGTLLVCGLLLAGVFAPWLAPYGPNTLSPDILQPPSWHHFFGTDELGRDVFSRVLYGARTSLPVAIAVVAASLVIGGTLGALAGFFGGIFDLGVMRLVELFFAFPAIILAMAVAASFGSGLVNAGIAIVLVSWPTYARVIRGAVLAIMHEDFISSSRLFGSGATRILLVDVTPNVVGPAIVLATLELGNAILLLASLSFLGLGVKPPTAEWGSMVAGGALDFTHWWVPVFAGLAIAAAVLGFNLVGDMLRDAIDPRIRRSQVGW